MARPQPTPPATTPWIGATMRGGEKNVKDESKCNSKKALKGNQVQKIVVEYKKGGVPIDDEYLIDSRTVSPNFGKQMTA